MLLMAAVGLYGWHIFYYSLGSSFLRRPSLTYRCSCSIKSCFHPCVLGQTAISFVARAIVLLYLSQVRKNTNIQGGSRQLSSPEPHCSHGALSVFTLEYFNPHLKPKRTGRRRNNMIPACLSAEPLGFPEKPRHRCRVLLSMFTQSD